MKTRQVDEATAHKLLRDTAMNSNQRIAEVARSLITAAELLGPTHDLDHLAAGFMPLLDSALLVLAHEKGFARNEGIELR